MSYRLSINPALELGVLKESEQLQFTYSSKSQMDRSADDMAEMLLFLQDNLEVMDSFSNLFVKEQLKAGGWEEILDD